MNELALFAGAGGGILGGKLLGWNTVGAVEIEKYPREVLLQRQRDGILEPFPIWDDITTFDGRPWKGSVDIITGGFPCQDISAAGKGVGITGERSGLWGEMARVIDEVRPKFAYVENSPMLTSRGLGTVLGDLAELGYDARWCVLGADDAGAPHRRKRIWILAYTSSMGQQQRPDNPGTECKENGRGKPGQCCKTLADTNDKRLQRTDVRKTEYRTEKGLSTECSKITYWDTDPADIPNTESLYAQGLNSGQGERKFRGENRGSTKPIMGRVAHGVAKRVDRLKAIGNGQVPGVAATAFIILSEGLL